MRLIPILMLVLCLSAQAGEGDDSERNIHVSLDEVVAAGVAEPVDGITSSGQPDAAALRVFAASGYTTVIDMRGPNENRGMEDFVGAVESEGMEYIVFPVTSADELTLEKAGKLDAVLSDIDGPVLLHCGSGNRVGAMLALRESLKGASDEEALAYGKDAGLTRLEPAVRKALDAD